MSGITDPSEEYFKDGLWAWVTDQWKKLIGDDAGHLQIDVVESSLPTGAATSANQTTMITALQLIDDLRAALNSVATDELDVVIDGQTADVEIKQTTAADLTPGVMGWDGTQWRKLALTWGYSGLIGQALEDTNLGAGANNLYGANVPAGEIWVIENVSVQYWGTTPTVVHALGDGTPGSTFLLSLYSPTVNQFHNLQVHAVLEAGDRMQFNVAGATVGDALYGRYSGYKMKIAE